MQSENVSLVRAFFRNRLVRLVLVLDLVAVIVVIALSIYKSNKSAVMSFMVAPVDAEIIVDGNGGYNNNGEAYYFIPGVHEVRIYREPLDEKVLTVELEPDHNTTVATFLSEDGGFEFYELNENLSSYNRLAEIASVENNQTIDKDNSAELFVENMQRNLDLFSKYIPIMEQTPTDDGLKAGANYQYDTMVIGDGRDLESCEKILCLYITDTFNKKEQYALSIIKKFGFDAELCQIIYKRTGYD